MKLDPSRQSLLWRKLFGFRYVRERLQSLHCGPTFCSTPVGCISTENVTSKRSATTVLALFPAAFFAMVPTAASR
jgi:hypothetical protein